MRAHVGDWRYGEAVKRRCGTLREEQVSGGLEEAKERAGVVGGVCGRERGQKKGDRGVRKGRRRSGERKLEDFC